MSQFLILSPWKIFRSTNQAISLLFTEVSAYGCTFSLSKINKQANEVYLEL